MARRRTETAPAALYAPRDTKAQAAARKAEKRAERKDRAYLAWVHLHPCEVCRAFTGVEAHHQPRRSQHGWHDRLTIPLCSDCHRGARGIHTLGVRRFEEVHCINVAERIAALNALYAKERPDEQATPVA